MSRRDVQISSPEGSIPAYAFTPDEGQGPWPAVIFYMDALAIRPSMMEMGQRLASNGYFVVLPDMFWRLGPYPPMDPAKVFTDPELRKELSSRYMGSTSPEKAMADTKAILAWLDREPEADATKVGTTGYCMGGGMSLRAAAAFPDQVKASASFHGGNLVTDADNSPHKLAPQMKAKVFVAAADKDSAATPEQNADLQAALDKAGVDGEVVLYEGALHGYAVPDMPVFNADAAERHWRDMVGLYNSALKG